MEKIAEFINVLVLALIAKLDDETCDVMGLKI